MNKIDILCDGCGLELIRGQRVVFVGVGRIYRDQLELAEALRVFCSTDCLASVFLKREAANPNLPVTSGS